MQHERGFTLIELLVVVLIIGILAAIAIPVFNGQRAKAKNTATKSALRTAYTASRSVFTTQPDYYGTFNADMPSYPSAPTAFPGESSLRGIQWDASAPNPANNLYAAEATPGPTADPRLIVVYAKWPNFISGPNDNCTSFPNKCAFTSSLICNTGKGNRSFCILDVPVKHGPEFPIPTGVYYGQSKPGVQLCKTYNRDIIGQVPAASVAANSIGDAYCDIMQNFPKGWDDPASGAGA